MKIISASHASATEAITESGGDTTLNFEAQTLFVEGSAVFRAKLWIHPPEQPYVFADGEASNPKLKLGKDKEDVDENGNHYTENVTLVKQPADGDSLNTLFIRIEPRAVDADGTDLPHSVALPSDAAVTVLPDPGA